MKRQLWGLILVGMLLGLAQPAWGDFYVVVAGGGVGTPITSAPYNITQPGFYYLKGNLSYTGTGNAIAIAASEVTLDLMGFSIAGPGSSSGYGIYINNAMNNVEVRNGAVKNFNVGIDGSAGVNRRLANLRVSGCAYGINDLSSSAIITGCQATNNTNTGIRSTGTDVIIDKNTSSYNASGFYLQGGE